MLERPRRNASPLALVLGALLTGCPSIAGLDDFKDAPSTGSGTGGGATTGTGGQTSGAGGAGGAGGGILVGPCGVGSFQSEFDGGVLPNWMMTAGVGTALVSSGELVLDIVPGFDPGDLVGITGTGPRGLPPGCSVAVQVRSRNDHVQLRLQSPNGVAYVASWQGPVSGVVNAEFWIGNTSLGSTYSGEPPLWLVMSHVEDPQGNRTLCGYYSAASQLDLASLSGLGCDAADTWLDTVELQIYLTDTAGDGAHATFDHLNPFTGEGGGP